MKVSDIMTKLVVTVMPDDPVLIASDLLTKHGLDGLPVVENDGTLVGLITQSNLITKISRVHIPTLLTLLKSFDLYRKDRRFVKKELEKINRLKVKEVMNQEPPLIYEGEDVETAMMYLSRIHGVNPTSVVTSNRVLVGVITRYDIFKSLKTTKTEEAQGPHEHQIDIKIDAFLESFKKNFLFISRLRTRAWFFINISFLVVGVIFAFLFW